MRLELMQKFYNLLKVPLYNKAPQPILFPLAKKQYFSPLSSPSSSPSPCIPDALNSKNYQNMTHVNILTSFYLHNLQPLVKKLFRLPLWASLEGATNPKPLTQQELTITHQDIKIVLNRLGLLCDADLDGVRDDLSPGELRAIGGDELSRLFEEEPCDVEEVKAAFDVFDVDKDGFIDANDLQKVLCRLGFKEGSDLEACKRMVQAVTESGVGRIGLGGFLNFMLDKCFLLKS